MIPLPPKRFDHIGETRYDLIRHKPWFKKLSVRRAKLPMLKAAKECWIRDGKSQVEAARTYGVDERELRDFYFFSQGGCLPRPVPYQQILDDAYSHYLGDSAKYHIRHYIEIIAPFFGVNARQVVEAWETDPTFYPTGYGLI